MTRVEVIEREIETLPEDEFKELQMWFSQKDWENWDRELQTDSASGALSFLVKEAHLGKKYGELKDL